MTGLRLTLDLPPSLNTAYQPNGHGGRRLTPKAEAYRDVVGWETRAAALASHWLPPPTVLLTVCIVLTVRHLERVDADNSGKVIIDGITRALHVDDSRVVDLRVRKRLGETEQAEVSVREAR